MNNRFLLITVPILILCNESSAQIYVAPNYSLKSHETLEIKQIEVNAKATTFYLNITNRITGGNFCADKNVFLIYPEGSRSRLISSVGIPVCPDAYHFKTIGEKLEFILTFPPLKAGTTSIDLLEECDENCFSFYGVILDNNMNRTIDDAFFIAESGDAAKALARFIEIAGKSDNNDPGVKALLCINIIKLAKETGNTAMASEWYGKLRLSDLPRVGLYLKHLNSQGIIY